MKDYERRRGFVYIVCLCDTSASQPRAFVLFLFAMNYVNELPRPPEAVPASRLPRAGGSRSVSLRRLRGRLRGLTLRNVLTRTPLRTSALPSLVARTVHRCPSPRRAVGYTSYDEREPCEIKSLGPRGQVPQEGKVRKGSAPTIAARNVIAIRESPWLLPPADRCAHAGLPPLHR